MFDRPFPILSDRRWPGTWTLLAVILLLSGVATPQTADAQTVPQYFEATTVASGLASGTTGFAFLPDERILVTHHQSGRVELVVDGVIKPEALLVVDSLVTSSEQGLLGIAIDPDYPAAPYIYLFHTKSDSVNQVSRFTLSGDLDNAASSQLSIDPASKTKIFSAPDSTRFHNGGTIRVASDKTLLISFGDDAYANDVQALNHLKGKIVRINRDGSVPADNPTFPDAPTDALPEVYAMGLRNPFRFALDSQTGDLFIGDVGTELYEELNVASGGENFGYPHYEGPVFFRDYIPLIPPAPTAAAYSYPQTSSSASAIALSVYRPTGQPDDASFPAEYDGAYFFADFFQSTLQYLLKTQDGTYTNHSFGFGFNRLVDAAIAADGSLYVLSYSGALTRIAYEGETNVGVDDQPDERVLALHPNYPNPFGMDGTTVTYESVRGGHVRLELFDMLGRRAVLLVDEIRPAGQHHIKFADPSLSAGLYTMRLTIDGVTTTRVVAAAGRQGR